MAFNNNPIGQPAAPKRKLLGVEPLAFGGVADTGTFTGNLDYQGSRAANAIANVFGGGVKANTSPGTDTYQDANKRGAQANQAVPYQLLGAPAKNADQAVNLATRANDPGTKAPASVWWNASHKDDNGNVTGGWEDVGGDGALLTGNKAPAAAHGMFSPDFNYNGPDNTQAGGSTYHEPAAAPAPVPTVGAGPGAGNDPFTPGTDAYKARQGAFDANYQQTSAGARARLQQTLAQQGLTGTGAGLALGNNLEAGLSADYLNGQNDMLANDPLRSQDFTGKNLANTSTAQQVARYGQETPLYIAGQKIANEGKSISNLLSTQSYDKAAQLLPYEVSAAQTGDLKAKADLQAFQDQAPYHLAQLKQQGKMTDVDAKAAQDAYDNRNWTLFWDIMGKVMGGAATIGGAVIGSGAMSGYTAPNSSYGAG